MKKSKLKGTYLTILTVCLCLFSACGKEEIYQPEVGVDGYVYTTQKLQTVGLLLGDIKVAGDFVYYARQKETGGGFVIERISLEAIDEEGKIQGQPQSEAVRSFSSGITEVPDYIAEGLQEKLSFFESKNSETSSWVVAADGSLLDMSKLRCFFSLQDFDVDAVGDLYCREEVWIGKSYEYEPMGATLSKWNRDGEKTYQIYYPDMSGFVLYGDGGACILGDGRIILVDKEGIQTGEISTEQYRGDGEPITEQLLRDAEGNIYYVLCNSRGIGRGFEMLADGSLQLREMEASFYEAVGGRAYPSSERKLLCGGYIDILYEYDAENGSKREVLNWIDSGFLNMYVQSIAQVSPEKLLIYYDDYPEWGIYLLTRTPVEELPERETIVMFSYEPTNMLRKAVMEFNKENDTYRIVIDSYGMEFSWFTGEGDATLVDLAVVSQTPPDILDMTFLDVYKYARKRALEDLMPYLERSSTLSREDFLENALEGMTIDGCLICIPNEFDAKWPLGRKKQLGAIEGWSMEDVYGFSDRYSESAHQLIGDIYGNIEKRDYLLNTFCAYYCLEEFIDWERGECRFDSEEFIRLLKWVQEYAEDNSGKAKTQSAYMPYIAEEVLLFYDSVESFLDMAGMGVRCGDETVLMGFPSADGEGVYPVYVRDALAITATSAHKEGAWTFLEYFLSESKPSLGFSAKKEWLDNEVRNAVRQEYYSGGMFSEETDNRKAKRWVNVGGEMVPCYAISQEQADTLLQAIESADFRPRSEKERMILRIISEEAESYYNGDKSIEEVIRIIQSRVNLLLQEG